jgi:hypothetical protein
MGCERCAEMWKVSEEHPFYRDIFVDKFKEAYITDRSTPPLAAAASNSNSEPPDKLILQDHHYLLQRKKHILLPQVTCLTSS